MKSTIICSILFFLVCATAFAEKQENTKDSQARYEEDSVRAGAQDDMEEMNRQDKRFMRFGRSGLSNSADDSEDDRQKRFMRFGKRYMRFGK